MKNKIIVFLLSIAILFFIFLSFENTYMLYIKNDRGNNVIYVGNDEALFTPSLSEKPLSKRECFDNIDYNYIDAVDLGIQVEELLSALPENAWQGRVYNMIIDECETDESHLVTDTIYSPLKNIIDTVIDVVNDEVISVAVQHEYDVTNPSYKDFAVSAQKMLDEFMDTVGIRTMEITQAESYYNYFEIMEEEYHKAGYTTNELIFREYVDTENKTIYLFVTEHYSKESPDKERLETENIAKISYSKSLIQ